LRKVKVIPEFGLFAHIWGFNLAICPIAAGDFSSRLSGAGEQYCFNLL
jgi:hypothetical protein